MRFRTKMVAGNLVNLKTTREAEAGRALSPKRVTCDPGSGPQGPGDKKNKKIKKNYQRDRMNRI